MLEVPGQEILARDKVSLRVNLLAEYRVTDPATAATRSLLNTAKLMEDNPTLIRLKELETLERLTEKVSTVNVHVGFDGLLSKLLPS